MNRSEGGDGGGRSEGLEGGPAISLHAPEFDYFINTTVVMREHEFKMIVASCAFYP